MWSHEAGTPYRYITRRLVQFQMEGLQHALRVFPGELTRALIFVLVARLSCNDWIVGDRVARPTEHTAFSINSLAASLRRPFETVRRHINDMIKAGICAKSGDGIILSPHADREAEITAYFNAQPALLGKLVKRLVEHDVPVPQATTACDNALLLQVRAAFDIGLIALENNEHGSWYELIIHGALIHESGLHVIETPELAREYGNRVIPNDLWRPVSIRSISEAYGMPYPTMRRHFVGMETQGILIKRAKGYTLSSEWTAAADRIAMSDHNVQYLLRHLRALAAAGVDLQPAIAP
jgi:DNA-binding transcriptional regulator YhcF (GntR family)